MTDIQSLPSPCINVCRMHGNLCVGCHRTLDEITRWGSMPTAEKVSILERIAMQQRKK